MKYLRKYDSQQEKVVKFAIDVKGIKAKRFEIYDKLVELGLDGNYREHFMVYGDTRFLEVKAEYWYHRKSWRLYVNEVTNPHYEIEYPIFKYDEIKELDMEGIEASIIAKKFGI